jgi:hypothetical protein
MQRIINLFLCLIKQYAKQKTGETEVQLHIFLTKAQDSMTKQFNVSNDLTPDVPLQDGWRSWRDGEDTVVTGLSDFIRVAYHRPSVLVESNNWWTW